MSESLKTKQGKTFVLITGGTGFIGSHIAVELLNNNYNVLLVDNLSNSHIGVVHDIRKAVEIDYKRGRSQITEDRLYDRSCCQFILGSILDDDTLDKTFQNFNISCVIHCAGLKAVGESCKKPLEYYQENVGGTISLLKSMNYYNVRNIIFSSSATVYDHLNQMPVHEESALGVTNPYGRTKLMIEEMLQDLHQSDVHAKSENKK